MRITLARCYFGAESESDATERFPLVFEDREAEERARARAHGS